MSRFNRNSRSLIAAHFELLQRIVTDCIYVSLRPKSCYIYIEHC